MIEPQTIWIALCLMLVFEGLVYGFFPKMMKKMMLQILAMPEQTLQNYGLGIAALGAACLYFIL